MGVRSLEAGLDVEMPLAIFRGKKLAKALREGRVSRELVVTSARRIVTTVLRFAAQRDEAEPGLGVVASVDHRQLARTVAARAAVLLKNDDVAGTPVLPLAGAVHKLAVIGRLATEPNLGDRGSSLVTPPTTSSILDGLRDAFPAADIHHEPGDDIPAAVAAAAAADVAIIVAGMGATDEGEMVVNPDMDLSIMGFPFTLPPVKWAVSKLTAGRDTGQFGRGGDRETLTLHAHDEELIQAISAANPRTAVVVIGGSAILMEAWRQSIPAILMAWYPGMEGGRGIADVLTGTAEPGGRLPIAIPTSPDQLPFYDMNAASITYDEWWGQRLLDRDGHEAAFPFGFGLGYTTFEVELVGSEPARTLARARVSNTGTRAGATVAQVYAIEEAAGVPQLVGFRRVQLEPGQETVVGIDLDLTPMLRRDPATKAWQDRPGVWSLVVALDSASARRSRHVPPRPASVDLSQTTRVESPVSTIL